MIKYFSMFSGIGGFENGIEKGVAFLNREANRRSQANTQTIQQKGEGLYPSQNETSGDSSRTYSKLLDNRQRHNTINCECIGYSEINKYAIQIYNYHYKGHKNYGDAKTIDPRQLPNFNLLIGGFPCHAFSIAGKRLGFDDTRGTLFFEILRILKEKRPRNFILENVKGLLSHDHQKTFRTIITSLSELGYDMEWQVLNSKNYGVPQNRERVFIIGHIRGESSRQIFPFENYGQEDDRLQQKTREEQERIQSEIPQTSGNIKRFKSGRQRSERPNSIITDLDVGQSYRITNIKGISPSITTPTGGHHIPKIQVLGNVGNGHEAQNIYNKDGLAPTVRENHGKITKIQVYDDYNSNIRKDGLVGSMTRNIGSKTARNGMKLIENMQVRRLTPIECERLQGFSDNWTQYGLNDKNQVVLISDSQRYKCLGNAVTVNVVEEIIKRLYNI